MLKGSHHFKTKVVGLPLLCGKNIGQSWQRGQEVGFSDTFFEPFSDTFFDAQTQEHKSGSRDENIKRKKRTRTTSKSKDPQMFLNLP
jgi:hypothetical protein